MDNPNTDSKTTKDSYVKTFMPTMPTIAKITITGSNIITAVPTKESAEAALETARKLKLLSLLKKIHRFN